MGRRKKKESKSIRRKTSPFSLGLILPFSRSLTLSNAHILSLVAKVGAFVQFTRQQPIAEERADV